MTHLASHPRLASAFRSMLSEMRIRKLRTMREFAEQEIIIPDGPQKGFHFRCSTQPHTALFFDEVQDGGWEVINVLGPPQSGKTLIAFVIPVLYYLFEARENVIIGLPSEEMGADKWREDLLPAIQANPKFDALRPDSGEGSKGGTVRTAVRFKNGVTLKFMSAGASHARLSGYTARIVILTELDKLDVRQGGESGKKEAGKTRQLFARTGAYGKDRRIYMEGTLSHREGLSWQNHVHGSCSELVVQCPVCEEWSTPGPDNVVGWREHENEIDAGEGTRVACSKCGAVWNNEQRVEMVRNQRLIHRGQSIDKAGNITGDKPKTVTFSFRYTWFNNMLKPMSMVGQEVWRAEFDPDEDDAKRAISQHVHVVPPDDVDAELSLLSMDAAKRRMGRFGKGVLPEETDVLVAFVDVGKRLLHWAVVGFVPDGRGFVCDYGRTETAVGDLGMEAGIINALEQLDDELYHENEYRTESGRRVEMSLVGVDHGGLFAEPVRIHCQKHPGQWIAAHGYGLHQERSLRNLKSGKTAVMFPGNGYLVLKLKEWGIDALEVDANLAKTRLHERLLMPQDKPGAWVLWRSDDKNEHFSMAKHLTAERPEVVFEPSRGQVTKWVAIRKNNHWLDAMSGAGVIGHLCGVRVLGVDDDSEA